MVSPGCTSCAFAVGAEPGAMVVPRAAARLIMDTAKTDRIGELSIYFEDRLSALGGVEQSCFQYIAPRDKHEHSQQ